jgi:hypothetical protein
MFEKTLLEMLIELIGEDQTRLLLYHRGGEQVYIPKEERLDPEHWLVKAVGMDSAKVICKHFCQVSLVLPLGLNGVRNRAIELVDRGLESGASINQIVRVSGLSGKTIRRRKKRLAEVTQRPKGPSLFDVFANEKN